MTDPIQRLHELAAERMEANAGSTGWEDGTSEKDYIAEAWEELADAVNYVSMDCDWDTCKHNQRLFMNAIREAAEFLHRIEFARDAGAKA